MEDFLTFQHAFFFNNKAVTFRQNFNRKDRKLWKLDQFREWMLLVMSCTVPEMSGLDFISSSMREMEAWTVE